MGIYEPCFAAANEHPRARDLKMAGLYAFHFITPELDARLEGIFYFIIESRPPVFCDG